MSAQAIGLTQVQPSPGDHTPGQGVRKSRLRLVLVAVLALAGASLAGQGLWINAKAVLAQVLLERAFAQSLATGTIVKPWSWLDTWPVARIELPRLGQEAIALEGSSGQALAFGPAHVAGTPDAGEPGTAVYAAHRDTHFAFLREVQDGDDVRITRRDGQIVTYRITGHAVVRWDQSGIDPHAPGRNLVLATCWPFDALRSGPLRYVVWGEEK